MRKAVESLAQIRNVRQAKSGARPFLSICPAFWSDGGCEEKAPVSIPPASRARAGSDMCVLSEQTRLKETPRHRRAWLLPKVFRPQHISWEAAGLPRVLLRAHLGNKDETRISFTTKSKQGSCKGIVSYCYHALLPRCWPPLHQDRGFAWLCSQRWV